MTRKNLSLLKRSSNRGSARPLSTLAPDSVADPALPSPIKDKFSWDQPDFDAFLKLYVPCGQLDLEWQPSSASVFKILFSFRISAAMWSSISDCDEVYNYWEPLHLFLYGTGFQTWEYSPVYAIRSYLYILIHFIPARLLQTLFWGNKIGVFITMRCLLGLFSVVAELAMYKALCSRLGNGIARLYIALTIISPGMFISSCAFLPSSFSMSANLLAVASHITNNWFLAIAFTALSALVSWPFAAVLGLPIVIEMLIIRPKELAANFLNYSLMTGTAIIALLIAVDSYYFGRIVLAPLNIVLYNVFSSHGPNLYGVEDVTFYIKNLLLNWNIAALLCPLAVPCAGLAYVWTRSSLQLENPIPCGMHFAYWRRFWPVISMFISLTVWLLIFFWQPHKEERFLFPIYPLIAVHAAIALDAVPRIGVLIAGGWSRSFWRACLASCLIVFCALSVSRLAALYKNFSAPIEVFKGLNERLYNPVTLNSSYFASRNDSTVHVCIGKEWYRFPSSFFLPSNFKDGEGRLWTSELNFIKSEFSGLLPKPYPKGPLPNITKAIPSEMNDLNREEPSRYTDISSCDYLVDLETPSPTELEPNFAAQTESWRSVVKKWFLLSSLSNPGHRAFYVPFVTIKNVVYGDYHLLERTDIITGV